MTPKQCSRLSVSVSCLDDAASCLPRDGQMTRVIMLILSTLSAPLSPGPTIGPIVTRWSPGCPLSHSLQDYAPIPRHPGDSLRLRNVFCGQTNVDSFVAGKFWSGPQANKHQADISLRSVNGKIRLRRRNQQESEPGPGLWECFPSSPRAGIFCIYNLRDEILSNAHCAAGRQNTNIKLKAWVHIWLFVSGSKWRC